MNQLKSIFLPILFVFFLLFNIGSDKAQTISNHFFGQNAWMPDTVGNASNCTQPPCILYGSLHNRWRAISASGANIIRFGGIAGDRNMPTNYQYIKMIDSIRAHGMEPILQVPFHNFRYNASQAAAIVQFVNVTKSKNIKYWIIGNEPDLEYSYTSASQVSGYIKSFASAMKAVDPTIKIIGPETAWFDKTIIDGLTNPGGADDITGTDANGRYYVDIISFHTYPYDGTQTRASMISSLMQTNGFNDNLSYLNSRLASCNSAHSRSGSSALVAAVTEANVNWQNSSSDNLNGTGVNSFIGGQFIAEMLGIGMKNHLEFMNIWSVVEGNTAALNIGYIDGSTNNKKPAYYHFQMMAQNFSGSYLSSTSTQTNVKVFSAQNATSTSVMIMNQDASTNYSCTVRLNNSTVSGNNALKINVNASIAQEYNDVIGNQTSMVLVFDAQGALTKKIVYSLASQASNNLAPVTTTYALPAKPVSSTPAGNLMICAGTTATLMASSGTYSVNWFASATSTAVLSTGSVYVSPALTANGTSVNTVTYYSETAGYSSQGRTAITVTVNPIPVISVNSGTICPGNSFVMVPSGAANYVVTGGSFTVTPAVNSSYSVTGTSSAGCSSGTAAVSYVTIGGPPSISVNNGTVCAGNVFSISPIGATSYTYSSGSATVIPSSNTTYTVYGSNGGCMSTAVLNVTVLPKPVVAVSSGSICSGSTFVMVATGANSYSYSGGSAAVSPQSSTNYTVTGFNNAGCAATAVSMVTVVPGPSLVVNSGTICAGNEFTIIASGANSITLSSGNSVVKPVTSSVYTVTGTSGECVSTATVGVVVNPLPTIIANGGTICFGHEFVIEPKGAASYTFSSGSATVNPIVNTTYTVTGTDANGCTNITVLTVQVDNSPSCVPTKPGDVIEGVANQSVAKPLTVYPNPNNGEFTMESNEDGQCTVYSMTGQIIRKWSVSAGTSQVNIGDLPGGIYLIKVQSAHGQQTARVIRR